jgi:hypothetical protein
MSKQYIVTERVSKPDSFMMINDDTTALDDIWHSVVPHGFDHEESLHPKVFDTKKEAVAYKNRIQSDNLKDWEDITYEIYAKTFGYLKPVWKVEEWKGSVL